MENVIIFLDVDGVLNISMTNDNDEIPRDIARRLIKIVNYKENTKIVISSTWKYWPEYMGILNHCLKECGLLNKVIGVTPDKFDIVDDDTYNKHAIIKTAEILEYITINNVKDFIVIDDIQMVDGKLMRWQIQPNAIDGISDDDLSLAMWMLNQ